MNCPRCGETAGPQAELQQAFQELHIEQHNQGAIFSFLGLLEMKGSAGKEHLEHSIRVGLLARKIAAFMHLDQKPSLYAGLLHDVGKALIGSETLAKKHEWTTRDTREMDKHVEFGFRLLQGRFDFSAEISKGHHTYQKRAYPKRLPKARHRYSFCTQWSILVYQRIVSLADSYDAMHRVNSATGGRKLRRREIRALLLEGNTDIKVLVEELFKARIF